jgi:hypothetical protein
MLVLPIGLASCAPDEDEELETEVTPAPDTGPGVDAVEPVTVDINNIGESEVEGEATISRVGESLMVSLQLEELSGTGPFRAQIVSGRCEDVENVADRATEPGTTPATPPPAGTGGTPTTTPGTTQTGQVLATLEPIQVSGTTGTTPPAGQPGTPTTEGQAGMSHSTIPVTDLRAAQQARLEVHGQGAVTIACGNIDNLNQLLSGAGTTGGATMTPPAGTTPNTTPSGTPGSRP